MNGIGVFARVGWRTIGIVRLNVTIRMLLLQLMQTLIDLTGLLSVIQSRIHLNVINNLTAVKVRCQRPMNSKDGTVITAYQPVMTLATLLTQISTKLYLTMKVRNIGVSDIGITDPATGISPR